MSAQPIDWIKTLRETALRRKEAEKAKEPSQESPAPVAAPAAKEEPVAKEPPAKEEPRKSEKIFIPLPSAPAGASWHAAELERIIASWTNVKDAKKK